jgi:hypothetical protein
MVASAMYRMPQITKPAPNQIVTIIAASAWMA